MKRCYVCKETKSLSEFGSDRAKKDGHSAECRPCRKILNRKYRSNNKEKLKEMRKEHDKKYIRNNLPKVREWNRNNKRKYRQEPAFKFMDSVSTHVWMILKRQGSSKNGESVLQHLPYTKKELEQHLVSQFTEGMTLDNYGLDGWHIDHIIPQSKLLYDSMDHPNFQKCWALENLQPLWAADNRRKGNKIL
jgi:hypothetical protein